MHRLWYLYHNVKSVLSTKRMLEYTDCNYSDVSLFIDAAGSSGLSYQPYYHGNGKKECRRFDLLRMKSFLVKVIKSS